MSEDRGKDFMTALAITVFVLAPICIIVTIIAIGNRPMGRAQKSDLDQEVNKRVSKLEYDSLVLARKWSLVKNPTPAQLEEMVKEKEGLEKEWEETQKWIFEEFEKQEKGVIKKEGLEEKKTSP